MGQAQIVACGVFVLSWPRDYRNLVSCCRQCVSSYSGCACTYVSLVY